MEPSAEIDAACRTCRTCRPTSRDEHRGIYGKGGGWVVRWGAPGHRVACPDCDENGAPRG